MTVSVLLITYNQASFIEEAIDSVLMQDFPEPFELIVCDDHSTDETIHIVEEKLRNIPNHRLIVQPQNVGTTRNYQAGFAACSGEFICVLEGDDYWIDPGKITAQVSFMREHPAFSACSHLYFKRNGTEETLIAPELTEQMRDPFTAIQSGDLIRNHGLISNFSTGCYRRSMLERIPSGVYETISFDWMVNISIGTIGPLARLNKPMSVYRISENGVWSGRTAVEQLQGMIDIIPVYNSILGNRFDNEFSAKRMELAGQLQRLKEKAAAKKQSRWLRPFRWLTKTLFPFPG